jgi:hypothetical protein
LHDGCVRRQCTDCWFDANTNANYIARAANQAVSMGQHIGFYSSVYEWAQTMGTHTDFAKYPLWYAHWDGQQSFSDGLYHFGGWNTPAIKQYADSGPCGYDVDSDWYPGSVADWRAQILNSTQARRRQFQSDRFRSMALRVASRAAAHRHQQDGATEGESHADRRPRRPTCPVIALGNRRSGRESARVSRVSGNLLFHYLPYRLHCPGRTIRTGSDFFAVSIINILKHSGLYPVGLSSVAWRFPADAATILDWIALVS